MYDPNCTLCPLHRYARHVCIGYDGDPKPDVLFVGQNPGSQENREGRPFVGDSGALLRGILTQWPHDVSWAVTNAVKCYSPGNREPTLTERKACTPYLERELLALRPLVVVALGNVALQTLTGGSGITSNRGRPNALRAAMRKAWGEHPPQVLCSWHPAYVAREPSRRKELVEDLDGVVRFVKTLRGEEQGDTVPWVLGTENIMLDVEAPVWAFDIEANGVNYRADDFCTTMIGVDDGKHVVVWREHRDRALAILQWRQNFGLVNVGHNSIGYDDPALGRTGSDDTLLLGYLADESASGHGLQAEAIRHLHVPPWKDDVTWDWSTFDPQGPDFPAAAQYNARDVRYTHRLYTTLAQRLGPPQMNLYVQLLKPAARMFQRMHCTGIYLSRENLATARADVEVRLVEAQATLDARAIDLGIDPFNARSYAKVGALLYDGLSLPCVRETASGGRGTDAETLQALRLATTTPPEALPVLDALLVFRETDALYSRYLKTADKFIEADGRAHPSYSLTSTMTGRTACYGFGIQRWPRDAMLRRCIAAPPGKKLIICDLSQIELRSMASLSRDAAMLQMYRSGVGDAHAAMAERIVRLRDGVSDPAVPVVWTKDDRYIAKPINFGCLYGAEPPTLQAYALKVYGVRLTIAQAEVLRNVGFFGLFTGLPDYYTRIHAELKRDGFVTSPLGRRRRLENIHASDQKLRAAALREGINTPNQGFASDIALLGTLACENWNPVAFIHDAAIFEVDEDVAEYAAGMIRFGFEKTAVDMLEERFGVVLDVPLVADVAISDVWGM